MKKWIFIGLGGLLLTVIIRVMIYTKKDQKKAEKKTVRKIKELFDKMQRNNEDTLRNFSQIQSEIDEEDKNLDNIILANGETAKAWLDRVLRMDQNEINLEMKIDP